MHSGRPQAAASTSPFTADSAALAPPPEGINSGLVAFGFLLEDQAKAAGKGTAGIRGGDGEGTGLHGSNQIFKSLIR